MPPNQSFERTGLDGLRRFAGQRGAGPPLDPDPSSRLETALPVLAVALSLAACAAAPSRPKLGPEGILSLSGEWAGTFEARQAGECTLNGKNKSSLPIRMKIAVSDGGGVEIIEYKSDSQGPSGARISGTISPDGLVSARPTFQAKCSGEPHEHETILTGCIVDSPGGPRLEMSGLRVPCPDNGCKFNVTYRLVRRP
jgi:hypothetical protein